MKIITVLKIKNNVIVKIKTFEEEQKALKFYTKLIRKENPEYKADNYNFKDVMFFDSSTTRIEMICTNLTK